MIIDQNFDSINLSEGGFTIKIIDYRGSLQMSKNQFYPDDLYFETQFNTI